MSMWAKYLEESQGIKTIENEYGCASFLITGHECYIKDIYVLPEFRKSQKASQISDEIAKIAKDNGCKYLTGTVKPSAHGSSVSMLAQLKYGFKLHTASEDLIVLIKEIT